MHSVPITIPGNVEVEDVMYREDFVQENPLVNAYLKLLNKILLILNLHTIKFKNISKKMLHDS